jgi:hypothetical protein
VQVRRGTRRYRTLRARTTTTTLRRRAPRGSTLTFRVTATDAAGNVTVRRTSSLIPLDQTSRRLRLDDGWRRSVRRRGAYGGSVAIARRAGARAVLRFRGRGVAVFGTRRVLIDGRRRSLRARTVRRLRPGRHRLVLLAPRPGARLDAVAVRR